MNTQFVNRVAKIDFFNFDIHDEILHKIKSLSKTNHKFNNYRVSCFLSNQNDVTQNSKNEK